MERKHLGKAALYTTQRLNGKTVSRLKARSLGEYQKMVHEAEERRKANLLEGWQPQDNLRPGSSQSERQAKKHWFS
jgi:hypothetical protein